MEETGRKRISGRLNWRWSVQKKTPQGFKGSHHALLHKYKHKIREYKKVFSICINRWIRCCCQYPDFSVPDAECRHELSSCGGHFNRSRNNLKFHREPHIYF